MNTSTPNTTRITKLDFSDRIYVYLSSGDMLTLPYTYTKRIAKATPNILEDYRLIADGIGVHFSQIDEDISLKGILQYKTSHELMAS
jgi:hypothetical protein